MKTLELNQMELLHGGVSCSGGFGLAAGLLIGGFITAASGGTGIGGAIYIAGAAATWINGVFNKDC
ncbi:hypothetical protein V1T75_10670 [Tenacibaculum sp. FZY0031]|uniref:hypothetical protein n=1 Tax=unclassified Tenacibaculum TaxID=2635139 RepID=UPI002EBE542D|nr:hypothetical protein [Tenacibaculum sp. FZY0031]